MSKPKEYIITIRFEARDDTQASILMDKLFKDWSGDVSISIERNTP